MVKSTLYKHRFDKSSWSAHRLLQQLIKLNELLRLGNTDQVWAMLTPYTKQKKPVKASPLTRELEIISASAVSSPQSPDEQRQLQVLGDYVKRHQERGRLPRHIPKCYGLKLLLPLALHEKDVLKLNRVQHQLSKGPPRSTLTFTTAGSGRIWFVRSAVNKAKNQSKALGVFIRQEKKQAQKRLNNWETCKENAIWALHEALWEQCIEDGTLLAFTPNEYLHNLSGSLEDESTPIKTKKKNKCPPKIIEWLSPINEVMMSLRRENSEAAVSYRKHKEKTILESGQLDYFQHQNEKVYANRVKRFENLVKKRLPYVVPFIPGRDLRTLLAKYRL